jgi:Cu2+-exporting ATPase
MRRGILIKNPTALDRLAEIDAVVFDKTGTLTEGALDLCEPDANPEALCDATALAQVSRHPLPVALTRAARERSITPPPAADAAEQPGQGIIRGEVRLGSRTFCSITDGAPATGPELWLIRPGTAPVCFAFRDRLRSDAGNVVASLKREGLAIKLRSGDNLEVVDRVADILGIEDRGARQTPSDKVAALEALRESGAHALMAGDGLNDAPALAAAHVSISPSTAADISQTAADIVFQGARLSPVLEAIGCAKRARAVARENIGLALGYNALMVPLAVAGHVTPLIAAIAMSSSSLIVVLNSFRVGRRRTA